MYRSDNDEPRYGPADPFEDEYNPRKTPKWARPKSYKERIILSAVSRKQYKSIAERDAVLRITNEITETTAGLYPFAWVERCCEIAKEMRQKGKMIQLKGLLTLIGNHERKREFLDKKQEQKGERPRFQRGG